MPKRITFVTGNPHKLEEAKSVLKGYGIIVEPLQINIDEIQHHDPLKITEAKVKSAYEKAGQPVVGAASLQRLGGIQQKRVLHEVPDGAGSGDGASLGGKGREDPRALQPLLGTVGVAEERSTG